MSIKLKINIIVDCENYYFGIKLFISHTTQSNYYASIIYLNFINKETSLNLNLFLKVDRKKRAKKYTVCELKFFIHRLFTSISHALVILNMI